MYTLFDLPEQDVYDIKPLESMNDLLVPETSLCIFHNPCWSHDGAWACSPSQASRVSGLSNSGGKEILFIQRGLKNDLGRYKSRLDKHLLSAYLFVSWRKRWGHTFRMFQQHELIAEFPDFESAMAAYMPDGFTPQKYYRFAHTVQQLHFCSIMRRRIILAMLRLLHQRVEQLSRGEKE